MSRIARGSEASKYIIGLQLEPGCDTLLTDLQAVRYIADLYIEQASGTFHTFIL